MSFSDFQDSLIEYYTKRDYITAMNKIIQYTQNNEKIPALLYYWKAIMHCRLNEKDEALASLKTLINKNGWLSQEFIANDTDLTCINQCPEYAEILTIFSQKESEAKAEAKGDKLIFYPKREAPYPTIFILHGDNENIHDTADYWKGLTDLGYMLVCLESKETGLYNNSYVWNNKQKTVEVFAACFQELESQILKTDFNIAGFSKGAVWALKLFLQNKWPIRQVGLFAPNPCAELLTLDIEHAPKNAAIHFLYGEEDPYVLPHVEHIRAVFRESRNRTNIISIPDLSHEYPLKLAEYMKDCFGPPVVTKQETNWMWGV